MATAYIAVAYLIDESGERKNYGDPVEIATTTDAEKADYERLVSYGIITAEQPQPKAARSR